MTVQDHRKDTYAKQVISWKPCMMDTRLRYYEPLIGSHVCLQYPEWPLIFNHRKERIFKWQRPSRGFSATAQLLVRIKFI